jgi:hypothetical protein
METVNPKEQQKKFDSKFSKYINYSTHQDTTIYLLILAFTLEPNLVKAY